MDSEKSLDKIQKSLCNKTNKSQIKLAIEGDFLYPV